MISLEKPSSVYFAYGSNMWPNQIHERCPNACPLGIARLDGYRLIINEPGYATITPHSNGFTYGVLWHLSPSDERSLDEFEKVQSGFYRKETLSVQDSTLTLREALVYIAANDEPGTPAPGYLAKLLAGARAFALPEAYQRFLASFQG
jgi:gamma-glutamylcyclotransferase (GGCT)/AIG2-like uncharacterized protein YtfP